MSIPELYGLVLVGGKSTRMGSDKSLIRYHGVEQRVYSYKLLDEFCTKTFLSCNQEQAGFITLPHIVDTSRAKGPLGGILTAMERFPDVAWLVLACDMPYVNNRVITKLVDARASHKLASCFYHTFPEPLCTIYEPATLPLLQDLVKSGNLSPKGFLSNHDVEFIPIDIIFKKLLKNINTPEDRDQEQFD